MNFRVAGRNFGRVPRLYVDNWFFLLLDEPFSHLDESNIEILTDIINQELENQNAGFIMTTLNNEYLFKYDKILNL